MNQFKRWLKAQLVMLDKLAEQPYLDEDFGDMGQMISEAARKASMLGFGQWSFYADTEQLGIIRAREILSEIIAALDAKTADAISELLTLEQAAKHLGYSPSGLRKMAKRGDVRCVQSKPSAPLKFRREWLDEFGKAQEKAKPQPLPKKSAHGLNANLLG